MPFYEYVCTRCGAATTILQKISDPVATQCPKCNEQGLSKQISAAGFRLKGGGWYETDFKSGDKKNLAGEGSSGAVAKSDKPAAKSEAAAAPATPAPAPTPAAT